MRNLHRAAVVAAAATMATPLLINADTARAGTPTADPESSSCTGSVPFISGEGGYAVYRIPAVVRAADGAVIAFAEARESRSDAGSIDLVRRRSVDGGCTWGPQAVVADQAENTIGNPAPVVDPSTGDLVLLSTRNAGTASEAEILRGEVTAEDSRRVFVQRSTDDGRTFSPLEEITATTKLPDWRWYATGPGHAVAVIGGKHNGRLVVPANHSSAPPAGSADTGAEAKYYGAHSLLSDDGGRTWRIGFDDSTFDGELNTNESIATQLRDGSLYFNTRDQNGTSPATRADAVSVDGGESLVTPYAAEPGLVGPVVQGSVLQVRGGSWPLVYSGPSDPTRRAGMALRVSEDAGDTWENRLTVSTDPAAYSDLVQLPGRQLGLLYETGTSGANETITFRRIPVGELR